MTTATPQPYTVEQIQEIMAETNRLIAKDQRPSQIANARASATTTPPSANDLFFNEVLKLMEGQGLTKAAAMRRVAIGKPALHAAYIAEFNDAARAKADGKAKAAARDRLRRNATARS